MKDLIIMTKTLKSMFQAFAMVAYRILFDRWMKENEDVNWSSFTQNKGTKLFYFFLLVFLLETRPHKLQNTLSETTTLHNGQTT